MLRKHKRAGLAFLLLASVAATAVQAEVLVIGNSSLPVKELELQKVRDIWLGKTKHLADGVPVRPIDQSASSRVRDDFYLKSLDKSPHQVKAYWARITFTGKAEAPTALADDVAVKNWVASHSDAIGYIDSASADSSIKVLLKLK